jgi:hypothetical protein
MAAIDTFGVMVADVAAAVAAVAAVTGLRCARQTVREARAERLEAEHVRLVRRLEWVGETIEHIDRLAEDDQQSRPLGESWRRGRQLLAQGFVGLDERLPQTAELVRCADPFTARAIAVRARDEVSGDLQRLAREQALRHDAGQSAERERSGWLAGHLARPRLALHGSGQADGQLRPQRHRARRDGSR